MPAKNQTAKIDYFMDVILRNYCRAAEENDILYEELEDLRGFTGELLKENADLRFRLHEAGVEAPPTVVQSDEDDELTN